MSDQPSENEDEKGKDEMRDLDPQKEVQGGMQSQKPKPPFNPQPDPPG